MIDKALLTKLQKHKALLRKSADVLEIVLAVD
jgi:hypothetical protein